MKKVVPPRDRVRVSMGYRIGIPGTYSSFEVTMDYETSAMMGEDPQALFRRAMQQAEVALERERAKTFKRLDLDDGAAPRRKGKVRWAST